MKNNPEIEFYRSNAVHTVLNRYDFSEDEKKIIQAAIVTAKRKNPNMALIVKSDALLKMVATSREPIKEKETKESVKNRIRAESQYSHTMAKSKYDWNIKPMVYKIRDDEATNVTADTLHEVRCLNNANSVFY